VVYMHETEWCTCTKNAVYMHCLDGQRRRASIAIDSSSTRIRLAPGMQKTRVYLTRK